MQRIIQCRNKLLTIVAVFVITVFAFMSVTHASIITITDIYDPPDIYLGTSTEPLFWEHDMTSYGYDPNQDHMLGASITLSLRDDEGDGYHTGTYWDWENNVPRHPYNKVPMTKVDGPWLEFANVFFDIQDNNEAQVWLREFEVDTWTANWELPPTDLFGGFHDGTFLNALGSTVPPDAVVYSDPNNPVYDTGPAVWPRTEYPHSGVWGVGSNNDFYFESSILTFTYSHSDDGPTNPNEPHAPVPEPTTVALLGIGLAGMAGAEARRRRKKKGDANKNNL